MYFQGNFFLSSIKQKMKHVSGFAHILDETRPSITVLRPHNFRKSEKMIIDIVTKQYEFLPYSIISNEFLHIDFFFLRHQDIVYKVSIAVKNTMTLATLIINI